MPQAKTSSGTPSNESQGISLGAISNITNKVHLLADVMSAGMICSAAGGLARYCKTISRLGKDGRRFREAALSTASSEIACGGSVAAVADERAIIECLQSSKGLQRSCFERHNF